MPVDCRERILSNNYYDAITDFPVWLLENYTEDQCYADVDGLYNIIYFERSELRNPQDYFTAYRSVPKLFGLMQTGGAAGAFDPVSLVASGITQVQRQPLALTGRGVIICFIDTGEPVIILSGRQNPGKVKGFCHFCPAEECPVRSFLSVRTGLFRQSGAIPAIL